MDPELKRRLADKAYISLFSYLKEIYCDNAEHLIFVMNSGNFISMSKRSSFVLSLKDLTVALFGTEGLTTLTNTSLLSSYSKEGYVYVGKGEGSRKVSSMVIAHNISSTNSQSPSLTELVLHVMGAYPDKKFHLFPLLLQDYYKLSIRLDTQCFPSNSFKHFMDIYLAEGIRTDPKFTIIKTIKFPPTIHSFYSQFFISAHTPKEREYFDVTPFEYYIIRFLTCISTMHVDPITFSHTASSVIQYTSKQEKPTILAVQLFLQYLEFLVNPQNPSKPSLSDSSTSLPLSLQRPDLFFLSAIAELWLSRDDRIPDDFGYLLNECGHQSSHTLCTVSRVMLHCLNRLIQHLKMKSFLVQDGITVHLATIEHSFFFFFAKQFALARVDSTIRADSVHLSDIVRCWCSFIQLDSSSTFIHRHYLFYRALLVILIKRLSLLSLSSAELRLIIELLISTFDSDVLSILHECDMYLTVGMKEMKTTVTSITRKTDYLSEGLKLLRWTHCETISIRMAGKECLECLITKLCYCYSASPSLSKQEEEAKIRELTHVLGSDETSFIEFYMNIREQTRPQINTEMGFLESIVSPIRWFLFDCIATQNHRPAHSLYEPLSSFELSWLTRGLIALTVSLNMFIFCLLNGGIAKNRDVNWDELFNASENRYLNLRWLGDCRSICWIISLFLLCKVIYWIGRVIFI